MFTDSHCHLRKLSQTTPHFPLLIKMLENDRVPFIMDIGTDAGDFRPRHAIISSLNAMSGTIPPFIHFTAGLWPCKQAIENQEESMQLLEQDIACILASGQSYAAVGECGIDRLRNGNTAAHTGTSDTAAEELLFKKQLQLAQRYSLAVVVHSRDGFRPTLECIDQTGCTKGVIHCFSYGIHEARAFLERGWYISLSGTITYAKSSAEKQRIATLLNAIPPEKLLLETDSPYLSPTALRGGINTPLAISHIYRCAATYLHCSTEQLAHQVYQNCRTLFAVPECQKRQPFCYPEM